MNSRIYRGRTIHERLQPVHHGFRYRIHWLGIDLAELDQLDRRVRGFGVDRWSLVGIKTADHGGPGGGGIRERVLSILDSRGIDATDMRIMLMTIPRILGYVFNPVNFYLCMDREGRVQALLAEVRNTFGEIHHYAAAGVQVGEPGDASMFEFTKRFYVSPFLDVDGTYFVRIKCTGDSFAASIILEQDGARVFTASMDGQGQPLSSRSLLWTLARMPLAAGSIMLRIQWQAILLRLRRGIRARPKPEPADPSTIPASKSSPWHWIRHRFVRYASKPSRDQQGDTAVEEEPGS